MKKLILVVLLILAGCGRPERTEPVPQIFTDTDGKIADIGVDTSDSDVGVDPDLGPDADPDLPDDRDIFDRLLDAPNVTGVLEMGQDSGYRYFVVDFEQRLDHNDPDSATFTHQAFLWHKDSDRPMVLNTTGYGIGDPNQYRGYIAELTTMMDGNQIILGHRFFERALPDAADQDWSKVNIAQAAADNHEIVESLKTIYGAAWVGTGWSKGGMTTIFHERFYPDDLDVAVPMVAPISFGALDARYPVFLADIGTPECRQTLDDTMIGALDRIEELVDVFNPPDFQREQYRIQLKGAIIGFSWAYWQYYGLVWCGFIPPPDAPAEDLVNFYFLQQQPRIEPRPITPDEAPSIAYSYQAGTQLGFQDVYPTGHLDRMQMLGYLSVDERAYFETPFTEQPYDWPWETWPPFDSGAMIDIDDWLRNEATDMIAVYGEYDPWSGGMVTLNEGNDSHVLVAPGASHGTLLSDLSAQDFAIVSAKISAANNAALFIVPVKPVAREGLRKQLIFLLQNRLL